MGRSRYQFAAPDQPHFITCTVLHWIPVLTRPDTVQILLDSLCYLSEKDGLEIYAYVILENHICTWWDKAPTWRAASPGSNPSPRRP